jgi:hypothetical protein
LQTGSRILYWLRLWHACWQEYNSNSLLCGTVTTRLFRNDCWQLVTGATRSSLSSCLLICRCEVYS